MSLKTLIIIVLIGLALPGFAQITNTPPPVSTNQIPTVQGFPTTVLDYFSSFNTNLLTFRSFRGSLWAGVDSIQNGAYPLANSLGLSYDLWQSKPLTPGAASFHLSAENTVRLTSVQGTILSEGAGFGLAFVVWDTRLTLYGEGVYATGESRDKSCGEVGARVAKALTDHTYAGVGIGYQCAPNQQGDNRTFLTAFAGFTF